MVTKAGTTAGPDFIVFYLGDEKCRKLSYDAVMLGPKKIRYQET